MLVALGGYEKAGKDAIADILVERHGWLKTYMSEPLERALVALNPWIELTHQDVKRLFESHRDFPNEFEVMSIDAPTLQFGGFMRYADLHTLVGYTESKRTAGVVEMLQRLGTEVGREIIDIDCWVRVAERTLEAADNMHAPISITGVRYPNELRMIRKAGGCLWWVRRPGVGPVNGHSSANTLSELDFDLTIDNDGTLEDLAAKVADLVVEMARHA